MLHVYRQDDRRFLCPEPAGPLLFLDLPAQEEMAANKVFGLAAVSFGLAALLIELDVQIGGISERYMIDYG